MGSKEKILDNISRATTNEKPLPELKKNQGRGSELYRGICGLIGKDRGKSRGGQRLGRPWSICFTKLFGVGSNYFHNT